MRNTAIFVAGAAVGLAALALQYVSAPAPLPAPGEYFLTELARAQIGPISIVIAMGAAVVFGYYLHAPPVLVGFAMLAVFPLVAVYEGIRYRGSHNLMPFEMAIVATWTVPLILAAWLGRLLARRFGRQTLSSATGERGITR